jgi:hypothetical protein
MYAADIAEPSLGSRTTLCNAARPAGCAEGSTGRQSGDAPLQAKVQT